jgi:molecular chaperone GrpE
MSKQSNDRKDNQREVPGDPADLTAAAAALEASESEIAKLRADLEDAADRALRAQAELDNYRKRARRELEDERRYALAPFLKDLLPVLDNMFRAIAHAEKAPQNGGLLEGVKMIAQSLLGVLDRHHCKPIDALHKPFDPAFHEAISQQPTSEFPPNTVVLVAQEGYMLHDRVLRAAQVIVSKAPD